MLWYVGINTNLGTKIWETTSGVLYRDSSILWIKRKKERKKKDLKTIRRKLNNIFKSSLSQCLSLEHWKRFCSFNFSSRKMFPNRTNLPTFHLIQRYLGVTTNSICIKCYYLLGIWKKEIHNNRIFTNYRKNSTIDVFPLYGAMFKMFS